MFRYLRCEIMKYSPKDEYHCDINEESVKSKFNKAREEFKLFSDSFRKKFDLSKPEKILDVYNHASKNGLFEFAASLRELVFGKDIHFYGVSYLWDDCVNTCEYCPGSIQNRKSSGYKPRELSIDEAIEDINFVISDGHSHICLLTGEETKNHSAAFLAKYLQKVDELGLDEIILNIAPLDVKGFKILRDAVKHTSLQFRVFQETYNKETYASMHQRGPKRNFENRYYSQSRALDAGFDNIGFGALFGLHRYPIEEIEGLQEHVRHIHENHGVNPARVCLPSANFLPQYDVKIPFILEKGKYTNEHELIQMGPYEYFDELIYALAKLALPHINLVSSERDPPGMLNILDHYASCSVINVHPGVGDNTKHHKRVKEEGLHFEQANSFSREPKKTLENMRLRGFNPLLKR